MPLRRPFDSAANALTFPFATDDCDTFTLVADTEIGRHRHLRYGSATARRCHQVCNGRCTAPTRTSASHVRCSHVFRNRRGYTNTATRPARCHRSRAGANAGLGPDPPLPSTRPGSSAPALAPEVDRRLPVFTNHQARRELAGFVGKLLLRVAGVPRALAAISRPVRRRCRSGEQSAKMPLAFDFAGAGPPSFGLVRLSASRSRHHAIEPAGPVVHPPRYTARARRGQCPDLARAGLPGAGFNGSAVLIGVR